MTKRTRRTLVAGLVMFVSACSGGGDGGTTSADSPTSKVPVTVAKQAGDVQSATVGATIAAPIVKVLNFAGSGVAGVTVTFTATGGDVLGATSVTTGTDGSASAGSWRLSTVAGLHTVSAVAAGVTLPASFTATASADVAKTMAKSAGDNQTGFAGSNVTTPPAVTIVDQYGNPVSGMSVTFSVATGGGSLTSPAPTSNVNGVAAVGAWRLGPAPASNTVIASATGLTSVTFTATGIINPCATRTPIALGQTVTGSLTANDCLFLDDYYADFYAFSIAASQSMQVEMTATAFSPFIDLGSATTDDYYAFGSNPVGSTTARIRILGPAGQYEAAANSLAERATGDYTFTLATWNGDIVTCATDVWVVPSAAAIPQSLTATDCPPPGAVGATPQYYDFVRFWADAGRTYTITMASSAVDPTLTLRTFSGQNIVTVATDDNSGGGTTARITWTPTADNVGVIYLVAAAAGTTGAYTFTVTRSGTAAAATTLPLGRARAIRRPAFAGVGVPWAFLPGPGQTAARDARRP